MHVLSKIQRAFHLPSALFYAGVGAAILSCPKNVLAAVHGVFTRSSAARTESEWTWRVIDLTPEAHQLLEELKGRLNLERVVLIAHRDATDPSKSERVYINPSDRENAPNFIGLSSPEFIKTFDIDHPSHLYYRLLLLLRLVQIKERGTSANADSLYWAVVVTSLAALHLTSLRGKCLVGLALGQWAGLFCAARIQEKALISAQLRAAQHLTRAELTRFIALGALEEFPATPSRAGERSWRNRFTLCNQFFPTQGQVLWRLTSSDLSQILKGKEGEEFEPTSHSIGIDSSSSDEDSTPAGSNCNVDPQPSPRDSFEMVNFSDLTDDLLEKVRRGH